MEGHKEKGPERLLTEREVMEEIQLLLNDSRVLGLLGSREYPYSGEVLTVVTREFAEGDEYPYYIEAEMVNGLNGEKAQFTYIRKGNFPRTQSSATDISVVYYDSDGIPSHGDHLVTYNSETNEWQNA